MAALLGGLLASIVGIIFIILWFGLFLKGLMAVLPAMFILGGALAVYLGIEEIKDKKASKSFDPDPGELKQEVEILKEEIKGLKGEKKEPEKGKEEESEQEK